MPFLSFVDGDYATSKFLLCFAIVPGRCMLIIFDVILPIIFTIILMLNRVNIFFFLILWLPLSVLASYILYFMSLRFLTISIFNQFFHLLCIKRTWQVMQMAIFLSAVWKEIRKLRMKNENTLIAFEHSNSLQIL